MQEQPSYLQEPFYVWQAHPAGNSYSFTSRSHNTSGAWILLDQIYKCALRDTDRLFARLRATRAGFSISEIRLQSSLQGLSVAGWAGHRSLVHCPPWAASLLRHKHMAQGPKRVCHVFGTLTVISSFSTQSGDTLCKWVK